MDNNISRNSPTVTDFSTPEPDNYNRAVFTTTPQECLLIEDQIVYYDNSDTHATSSQPITITIEQALTTPTPKPTKKPVVKPKSDGCKNQIKN